jgi:hypothetical protein
MAMDEKIAMGEELEVEVRDRIEAPLYWLIQERDFGGVESMNHDLARLIQEAEASAERPRQHSVRQYRAGFSTGPGFLDREHPSVEILRFLVADAVADYVQHARTGGLPVHGRPTTARGWGFILREGDWVCPHAHGADALAGVYYVEIPDLTFPEGCIEFVKPPGLGYGLGLEPPGSQDEAPETKRMMPAAGRLLLFPGQYVHLVYPFQGPGERIAVGLTIPFRPAGEA